MQPNWTCDSVSAGGPVTCALTPGSPLRCFAQASIDEVPEVEGVRAAIRFTARTSLLFFCLAFSAAALARLVARREPAFDYRAVVDELGKQLPLEVDFVREAEMTRRVRENLASLPGITVPRVVDELVSSRVIVTEYVHGRRLLEAGKHPEGVDGPAVAQALAVSAASVPTPPGGVDTVQPGLPERTRTPEHGALPPGSLDPRERRMSSSSAIFLAISCSSSVSLSRSSAVSRSWRRWSSVLDRRRLERGLAVLDVDRELHADRARLGHQLVLVLAQLVDELGVGQAQADIGADLGLRLQEPVLGEDRDRQGLHLADLAHARDGARAHGVVGERQGDRFGLLVVADGKLVPSPAGAGPRHRDRLLGTLAGLRASGAWPAEAGLRTVWDLVAPDSLVIFVGDGFDDAQLALAERLSATRREVLDIQVLGADERDFPFRDGRRFVDPESGAALELDASVARDAFLARFAQARAERSRRLAAAGVRSVTAWLDEPVDAPLRRLFARNGEAA